MKTALFTIWLLYAPVSIADTLTVFHDDRKCVFTVTPTSVTIEASEPGNTEKDQTALSVDEQKELKNFLNALAADRASVDPKKCSRQFIEWKTSKPTQYVCLTNRKAALFKLSRWLVNLF